MRSAKIRPGGFDCLNTACAAAELLRLVTGDAHQVEAVRGVRTPIMVRTESPLRSSLDRFSWYQSSASRPGSVVSALKKIRGVERSLLRPRQLRRPGSGAPAHQSRLHWLRFQLKLHRTAA